ncbi:MAG: MarR family transcriptional regulator, partial [Fulvivirga sp.]
RSLTRVLKNMEEKGLIFRKPDATDGRSVRIFLTDLGKKKKEVSRETVLSFNTKVREIVPQSKLEIFFDVINDINKIIDNNKTYENANNQN